MLNSKTNLPQATLKTSGVGLSTFFTFITQNQEASIICFRMILILFGFGDCRRNILFLAFYIGLQYLILNTKGVHFEFKTNMLMGYMETFIHIVLHFDLLITNTIYF